jgi:aminoglycoside 3-N-acetyltransferase I
MNYSYKRLESSDVEIIKQLLAMFGKAFNDMDAYQGNIPEDEYLRSLLSKPHFIALVALDGDEIIGGLAGYELEKFERERKEIYIYDLAVAEEHRRKGIATALISRLKDIAKGRGAYTLFVQADHGDEPAIKLYERFGKKEDVHHFDIPVQE